MKTTTTIPTDPRRRFARTELRIKAYITFTTANGCVQHGVGMTRDVSTHSAFIVGKNCLQPHSEVTVEFALRPGRGCRRMNLKGYVLRTEVVDALSHGFVVYSDREMCLVSAGAARE